jgi:glycosyltransferase involved in cell wall biosynthesis
MYMGEHSPRPSQILDSDQSLEPDKPPEPHPAGRPVPSVTAVIPAWNEARTIGAVVYAALDARLVDDVVVVDNASTDTTGAVATAHGARVVFERTHGKGEAMRTGVAASPHAGVIVFLDADLVGLRPEHVDDLVGAVVHGGAGMACGLFDRGPLVNRVFLGVLPVLTGQRAVRRDLFDQLVAGDLHGYRVEAALNSLVARRGMVRHDRVMSGLWHRTKEEKLASPVLGHATKVAMLASACWSYVRFAVARRMPQPAG